MFSRENSLLDLESLVPSGPGPIHICAVLWNACCYSVLLMVMQGFPECFRKVLATKKL